MPGMDDYDIRALFRASGAGSLGERALGQAPETRGDARAEVEMIDEDISRISGSPCEVVGFVDGIQAARAVTHRAHRPVYLSYVAAGMVSPDRVLLRMEERLSVLASTADVEWVESIGSNIPVVELQETAPDLLPHAASKHLSSSRDRLEVVCSTPPPEASPAGGVVVLDGGVSGRSRSDDVVGVVKSTRTRYLPDEQVLMGLPRGWRSPRFSLKEGFQGCPSRRYSCYVRLLDASSAAWNFGLVRLESFDPDVLDPAAAMCLSESQSPFSGDRRFDRHLAGVRMVEDTLRARRPDVFAL